MPKQKKRRKIWKRYKGLLYSTQVWTPPPVVSLLKIWVLDGNLFWGLWTHYWYKGPIQMVHEPRILYLVSAFPFFLMPFLSIFPQPPPRPLNGQGWFHWCHHHINENELIWPTKRKKVKWDFIQHFQT